jgi:hypothetical protein
MAKRDEDNQLAEAAVKMLRSQPTHHPAVHIPAIEEVLFLTKNALGGDKNNSLSFSQYKEIRTAAAMKAGQKSEKAFREIDRVIFKDYQLLQQVDEIVSVRTEVKPPNLPGNTLFQEDRPRWRRLLAHQHVLAFPEMGEILELFAPPGKPANAAQSRRGYFVFWRKLNQVTVDYAVDELCDLGMLNRTPQNTLCAVWAPPPTLCTICIRYYLALTEHQVDVPVETEELLSQVTSILPPRLFENHPAASSWARILRIPAEAILAEVGGSRVRLTMQGLRWFADVGLVSPLDCGKVLRRRRAVDPLINLRDALVERMANLAPINKQAIEDALRPI